MSQKTKERKFIDSKANVKNLLARYDIAKTPLGSGSFGKVFLATEKLDKNFKIAIKVIDKTKLSKDDIDSLRNEVKTMETVDHPNIVKYFETYDEPKYIYLCMELCTGGELFEKVSTKDHHLTEKTCSEYMQKMFRALNHCHAQDIIHRDIKPENIMFGADGEIKLIDFGFAITQHKKKANMEVAGTPYYIAPEVLGEFYGKECDIWSMGVVLYQLLTGKMPFDGDNVEQLLRNIEIGKFKLPSDVSGDCKDLLKKMIEKDPKLRITAQEALEHDWIKNFNESTYGKNPISNDVYNHLKDYRGKSLLKKAAVNLLVKHLDPKQIEDLKQDFLKMDTDNSGFIELKELEQALTKGNFHATQQELREIMNQLDYRDDNHKINYSEFLAATINVHNYLTHDKLKNIFLSFDMDDNGYIGENDLKLAFSKYGREITQEELKEIMDKHSKNGKIYLEEFQKMMEEN